MQDGVIQPPPSGWGSDLGPSEPFYSLQILSHPSQCLRLTHKSLMPQQFQPSVSLHNKRRRPRALLTHGFHENSLGSLSARLSLPLEHWILARLANHRRTKLHLLFMGIQQPLSHQLLLDRCDCGQHASIYFDDAKFRSLVLPGQFRHLCVID